MRLTHSNSPGSFYYLLVSKPNREFYSISAPSGFFYIKALKKFFICRGGSRIFFRRGCTRLLLYFNTNKPDSFFFLQNTSCIKKPQVISGDGVRTPCTLPLDPPLICSVFVSKNKQLTNRTALSFTFSSFSAKLLLQKC